MGYWWDDEDRALTRRPPAGWEWAPSEHLTAGLVGFLAGFLVAILLLSLLV